MSRVDCGECPNISAGCEEGHCRLGPFPRLPDPEVIWAKYPCFNAWPQCPDPRACTVAQACLKECSPVKGAVILDGRCPYDSWTSGRDVA